MDFVGPIQNTTGSEYKYIVTAIDYNTGWTHAIPTVTNDGTAAATMLAEIIKDHGTPVILITDNGAAFVSNYFAELTQSLRIQHRKTSAFYPQANGKVERMHQDLKNTIRRYMIDAPGEQWMQLIDRALLDHRNHIIDDLGASPAFLVYGKELRMPGRPVFEIQGRMELRAYNEGLHERHRIAKGLEPFRKASSDRSHLLKLRDALRTERNSAVTSFDIGDRVLRAGPWISLLPSYQD